MGHKHPGLMRAVVATVLVAALTGFSSLSSAALAAQAPVAPSVQQASAIARPSVVSIQTRWTGWLTRATFNGYNIASMLSADGSARRFSLTTSCSGFIANPEGYVVTAGHCVDDRSMRYGGRGLIVQAAVQQLMRAGLSQRVATIMLEDGYRNWTVEGTETESPPDRVVTVFPVKAASGVVVRTPLTANVVSLRPFDKGDVAVLKVTSQTPMPALEVASSPPSASMSQVVAIGYSGSVTSKVDADAGPSMKDGTVSGARTVAGIPFTEISAATSPGMSGGPVVDLQGRVVGTVSWKPGDETQAFNFITNISTIRDILASNNVNNALSPTDRTYRAGLTDYFTGKYHDAAKKFDQVLRLEPDHAQAQEYSRLSVANYPNEKTSGWLPLLAIIGAGVVVLGLMTGTTLLIRRRRRGGPPVPVIGAAGTEPAPPTTVEADPQDLPSAAAEERFATEPPIGGTAIPRQASAPEEVEVVTNTGRLRLFVSYAREDRQSIQVLIEGVERLHHEVWVDRELSGGQAWWNEILTRIRSSDALLIAVSPRLLSSEASALERQYAQRLGKPLLPVVIRPIRAHLLPPDLAPLQFVDYTDPGPMAAFELAGALASLPAAPALPDPLPDPPIVPISYLSGLTSRVHAANLTLDEQLALVAKLRTALQKTEEREAALELLQALQRRRDLYHAVARDIEDSLPQQMPDRSSYTVPGGTDEVPHEHHEKSPASDEPVPG